ncbi:MAG: glutamate racemase [Gemmatimonadales bacterium]
MSAAPIGIFDSGIGGLTVARAVHRALPGESTIYVGDTARVPWGNKSPETVRRYAREIAQWLLGQRVKMIVIACNTATAHALDDLRSWSPVPVIGVIEPGARGAAAATVRGQVGVIGTAGTMVSHAYRRALLAIRADLAVTEQPCPLFVPFVEEGWLDHRAVRLVAEEYLAPLRAARIDTLVLGCTHYPLLKTLIAEVMGGPAVLVDSADETAREVAGTLNEAGLAAPAGAVPVRRWIATDDAERFSRVGAIFMGELPGPVEIIDPAQPAHSGSGERLEADV